ncbi:unnamed protein product [Tilletia controversa]|nr:unnamed protein product [Tilletia controversa]
MNGNKRSAFTDAGPSQQTPASKRPKVGEGDGGNKPDANPTPSPAADRFFRVPELVKIVAEYVCRERVDLISLAAVCKSSRMPALQVWATHLDIPLDAAEKRFQLFDRHEALLHSVRFLRIRAGINEYARVSQHTGSAKDRGEKLWQALVKLLTLMSKVKGRERGPFIDLSFAVRDSRRIREAFDRIASAGRIVAIRLVLTALIDDELHADSSDSKAGILDKKDDVKNDNNDDHDQSSEDGSDADSDEGSVKWTERKQQDAEVMWTSSWLALSELVAAIQADATAKGGPGLQVFQLGNKEQVRVSCYGIWDRQNWLFWPCRIPMRFWSSLAHNTSSTLRELSLTLSVTDNLASILDLFSLPKLETFSLLFVGTLYYVDRLEAFLSRHLHLEALSVVVRYDYRRDTLSLQQTFPNLRWLDVDCNLPPERQVLRFIKRHPSLQGIDAPVVIKWAAHAHDVDDSTPIYGNVRTLRVDDLQRYKEIVNGGGRPSQVFLTLDGWKGPRMASFVSSEWWLDRQDVAHALTCLQSNYCGQTLDDLIFCLRLTSDNKALPNLTELAVYKLNPLDERGLATLFAALSSAPALRVLCISERFEHELDEAEVFQHNNSSFFCNADEMLVNCRFPAAFEYFEWAGLNRGNPTYFRFLPTHDVTSAPTSASSKEGAALTKRGRLQRIPSMFRTKISPIGIWDATFDPFRASTILNHSGVFPSLAL